VTGELYAGGAGLARGYLNRPALTAERFLPNPFSREPGARLYRTGDIGRHTLSGDVEYLGRQDRQVQIRGHRVELGEIEAALNRHAKVARAVVEPRQVLRRRLSFRGAPADSYEMRVDSFRRYIKEPILRTAEESTSVQIVAYFCAEQDAPSVEDLRAYLNDLLPTYMLPSAFEQLAELPLMPSGKLDRARLPETAVPNENLALPRTAVESELAAIWAEELDLPQVGVRDNFFAIGGDSLRAIRISARAAQRGLNICVADVYRHPTIEEVAAAGAPDGRRAEPFRIAEPFSQLALGDLPLLPAGATDAYPLCRMQSGLIFHSEQHLGSSVYRATFLYHLRGPLSADHICSAVEEVIRRYGVLRTSFDLVRFSEPLQIVHSEVPTPLTVIDLSHLTGEDQEAALVEWFEEERVRDFDLQKPPLCRFAVHRLSDDRFTLGLTCHDAILDGWSTSLLLGEVLTESWKRYSGKQTLDPGSRVSYGDFVAAERTANQSQESRRFWEQQLAEWTCVRIPGRCDRSCDATPRMAVLDVEIPEALSHSLSELTRAEGLPLKALLLAVHLRVLQVLSGCVDVTTGLEANGRLEVAGGDRSVGQHLNTVPFRLRLDGGSWLDLARKVLAAEQELLPHRRFPYAEIQKLSGTRSLYETTFNYTHFHVLEGLAELEGLEIEGGRGRELTHYALKTELNRDAFTKCLHLDVIYDANGLDQMQILEIGRRYRRALDAIAANPHARYDAADLLGAEERQTLIRSWNTTAAPVPARCLHELIEEMAGASLDRPATEYQGQQLTYRELSRRANRLARELQRLGARPEMLVGVYMERSLQLMVALLAILKAGAAYVPLDPEYPAERIAYMSEDADLELVLTQQHLSSRAPGRTVLTVSLSDDVTPDDDTDLGTAVEPLNAAYIIYTSGSTGRPKGAINTHQAIVNRLLWMRDAYHVDGSDRILQKTPISFDVSVWELFLPLICGATVVLARPGEHRDAASLVATLRNSRITTVHFVPSMLRLLFDEDLRRLPALRRVICSGEELTADLAVQFFQRCKAELHNLYGPTEAAVDVSAWPCDPAAKDGSVPIGRPITNVQLLVLDPAMHPCAVGVPGELFIGGICLARGYQARPGLTAERFCPNPHGLSLGERLYRTGDLAARRGDGSIEFLGRIDNQVKINGVRIEPGEIERTLLQHPAVVQAAVVPIATSGQHKQLAAYVVVRDAKAVTLGDLREFLKQRLPQTMVPSAFSVLDELPLTANGKLDRRRLVEAQSARERHLAELLERVEKLTPEEARAMLASIT
jgi:amino acid adenylation domain-containing protein